MQEDADSTHLLHSRESRSHDTPPKKLPNRRKLIFTPSQRLLEHVMLVCTLDLRPSKRPYILIARFAVRAFGLLSLRLIQTALMERVLAQEMHGRELQTTATSRAAAGLENGGLSVQVLHLFALGFCFGAVGVDEAAVLCDIFALFVDGDAEIFLDQAHCCNGVLTEGLDDLQWGHEPLVVYDTEDMVDFFTGLVEYGWGRCQVGEGRRVELRFDWTVFMQGFDCADSVVGGGIGSEDVEAEALLFLDFGSAGLEVREVGKEEDVGYVNRDLRGERQLEIMAIERGCIHYWTQSASLPCLPTQPSLRPF